MSPDITVILLTGAEDHPHLEAALASLAVQDEVRWDLVVVDRSPSGDLEISGARVVHEPSPSRGVAWHAGLAAASGRHVAWHDPRCLAVPGRLAAQVQTLDAHPEVDLLTTGIALLDQVGRPTDQAPAPDDAPPACWWSTVALRREAMYGLARSAFHPVELALYRALRDADRIGHLDGAGVAVAREHFDRLSRSTARDGVVLERARHQGDPELSAVVLAGTDRAELERCLESLCRQDLPAGALELVVAAEDGLCAVLDELEIGLPTRWVRRGRSSTAAARNAAVEAARAELLLFLEPWVSAPADLAATHLAGQRGRRAAWVGPLVPHPDALDTALSRVLSARPLPAGPTLLRCTNTSVPRRPLLEVGGFSEAGEAELGVRLAAQGVRTLWHPPARAWWTPELGRWGELHRARAAQAAPTLCRHPEAFKSWPGLEGDLDCVEPDALEAPAATLASLDLAALEAAGLVESATRIHTQLAGLLPRLEQELWTRRGWVDGLRAAGASSFPEVLRRSAVDLSPAPPPRAVILPPADSLDWVGAVEAWVENWWSGDGALIVRSHPVYGCPPETIRRQLAGVLSRFRGEDQPPVLLAHLPLPASAEVRLFAAARAWIPTGGPHASRHRDLAAAVDLIQLDPSTWSRSTRVLATERPFRFLAWPDWSDAQEMLTLLSDRILPLLGHPWATLVLRHDPERDPPLDQATALLQAAFAELHPDEPDLDVLFEAAHLDRAGWASLGRALHGILCLPSGDREGLLEASGAPLLADAEALTTALSRLEAFEVLQVGPTDTETP